MLRKAPTVPLFRNAVLARHCSTTAPDANSAALDDSSPGDSRRPRRPRRGRFSALNTIAEDVDGIDFNVHDAVALANTNFPPFPALDAAEGAVAVPGLLLPVLSQRALDATVQASVYAMRNGYGPAPALKATTSVRKGVAVWVGVTEDGRLVAAHGRDVDTIHEAAALMQTRAFKAKKRGRQHGLEAGTEAGKAPPTPGATPPLVTAADVDAALRALGL